MITMIMVEVGGHDELGSQINGSGGYVCRNRELRFIYLYKTLMTSLIE
jgi:hypothetical protein